MMKTVYAFLAANRYWPNRDRLKAVYEELCERLHCEKDAKLITDDDTISLPEGDCVVIVPMSGAVQKRILDIASRFRASVLYGAYISGNASTAAGQDMMRANAAPTLMDTWAVLHRRSTHTLLALNQEELGEKLRILEAYCYINGATVLKIGQTEPWVVSNASDTRYYEDRFGVKIVPVAQEELEDLFLATTQEQAAKYFDWFTGHSQGCVEPTQEDIWNASRMACALVTLLEKYHATGAALACFNLLRTGTNACLGVSYVNNSTDMCVGCECDMDSTITMLLMKKLTDTRLWMANPGIHPDGTINFSHCTSPVCCTGCAAHCILRSHHESGIGVSLQVTMPENCRVTACRISNEAADVTIQLGVSVPGAYEEACRTQMYVRFDDMAHYLDTVLGCHQVFAFEDISDRLHQIANIFGLRVR